MTLTTNGIGLTPRRSAVARAKGNTTHRGGVVSDQLGKDDGHSVDNSERQYRVVPRGVDDELRDGAGCRRVLECLAEAQRCGDD